MTVSKGCIRSGCSPLGAVSPVVRYSLTALSLLSSSSLRPSLLKALSRKPRPTSTSTLRAVTSKTRLTELVPAPANNSGLRPAVTTGRAGNDKFSDPPRTAKLNFSQAVGQPTMSDGYARISARLLGDLVLVAGGFLDLIAI